MNEVFQSPMTRKVTILLVEDDQSMLDGMHTVSRMNDAVLLLIRSEYATLSLGSFEGD